jgi:hypothetical protein
MGSHRDLGRDEGGLGMQLVVEAGEGLGLVEKNSAMGKAGRPRAIHQLRDVKRKARRRSSCEEGVRYAMKEGRKIEDVTMCIL